MVSPKGSVWRKWDLHAHSPFSEGYSGSWEQFEQQIINAEAEVIGVNDYFSIAGYRKLKERIDSGELNIGSKTILPSVEFRMRDVLKNKHTAVSGVNINFHIIFDPEVDLDALELFLKSLMVNGSQIGNRYNDAGFLKNSARVYFDNDVIDLLKSNEDFKDKYLIWIPYDEYGGLDDIDPQSDDWIKRGFISKANLLGSSNQKQIDFFLWKSILDKNGNPKFTREQFREWFDFPRGCIKGSDSHAHTYPLGKLRDSESNPIEKYCWIKGEPRFETLKQIVFEPEGRVFIGDKPPIQPTNTIEKITFSVPEDAVISVEQKDGSHKEEKFCFAGHQKSYELSPYFNTFIGGRGTGKSTILNFIGLNSKDNLSSSEFWRKLHPNFTASDDDIFSIDGVTHFEFIGQSQVERFATDKEVFTQAVYKRADSLSENKLNNLEEKLNTDRTRIEELKDLEIERYNLGLEKEELEEEKRTLGKSLKIVESNEYKKITDSITEKSNQKNDLTSWREEVDQLRTTVESIREVDNATEGDEESEDIEFESLSGPYQAAYSSAQEHIESAYSDLDEAQFKEVVEREEVLDSEIDKLENDLSKLLEKSGLSEENVLQVKGAPQRLVKINEEIANLKGKIEDTNKELALYDTKLDKLVHTKNEFETAIQEAITPLVKTLHQQALENNQEDIKEIGLEYYFDIRSSWTDIAESIISEFKDEYNFGGRNDSLKEFVVKNQKVFASDQKSINDFLKSDKSNSNYILFLKEIFAEEVNFKIYRAIRDSRLNDVVTYKKIQVLYDGRDIENASFGQKCTSVIVILMLFGNSPLIIDEPEAHLDSSLIANYLVPLIKKNKMNRQIIFATHNANFVVNGDAEKVFILSNDGTGIKCIETVIEDTEARKELLKLEGGKEAFKKRSDKLSILA